MDIVDPPTDVLAVTSLTLDEFDVLVPVLQTALCTLSDAPSRSLTGLAKQSNSVLLRGLATEAIPASVRSQRQVVVADLPDLEMSSVQQLLRLRGMAGRRAFGCHGRVFVIIRARRFTRSRSLWGEQISEPVMDYSAVVQQWT